MNNARQIQLDANDGNTGSVVGQTAVQERPDKVNPVQAPEDRSQYVRELVCLGVLAGAVRDGQGLADMFRQTVRVLPQGWPCPEGTFVRIIFDDRAYTARAFMPVGSRLSSDIVVAGAARGTLEVYCPCKCRPCSMMGQPASHHRTLIDVAAHLLGQAAENRIHERAEQAAMEGRQQLRDLASDLSQADERARQRLASALHDEVGQNLVVARQKMFMLAGSATSEEQAAAIAAVGELIETAAMDISSLTFDLCPPVLYEEGLGPALAWQANRFRQEHALSLQFVDDGLTEEPAAQVRVDVFQMIHELLTNVIRHARASSTMVIAASREGRLRVIVTDDGIGFDPETIRRHGGGPGGFGLFSIERRLEALGGRLDIRSTLDRGSRITVIVPLRQPNGAGERHDGNSRSAG